MAGYDNALTAELAAQIIAELERRGVVGAQFDYPGYISIPVVDQPDQYYAFGTANPTWGGELTTLDGQNLDAFQSIIPAASRAVDVIVGFIQASLAFRVPDRYQAGSPDGPTWGQVVRVLTDVRSVMEEQRDDNGELFGESNRELYTEIKAVIGGITAHGARQP